MNLIKTNNYINSLYSQQNTINKKKYESNTLLKDFIPVIEDDVARFLKLLIKITNAKKILEIGTSIGYSTTSMAEVLKSSEGSITTIEYDEKVAAQAIKNFKNANVNEIVDMKIGDARIILPELTDKFDMIFQDADKRLYPELLDKCIDLLKPGGLLIAEDTLFPVLDLDPKWHYLIPSIEEFNQLVVKDSRIDSTIIPLGDGVTIAIKK